MKNLQAISDKTAIGLSLLCTLHCLALPLAIVLLPSMAALPLNDEAFHLWMVLAVIPISLYALTLGCKKHKRYRLLWLGSIGVSILAAAAFLGHDLLGEFWEKAFTVLGAGIIALGHFWNYRLCQAQETCACPEPQDKTPTS